MFKNDVMTDSFRCLKCGLCMAVCPIYKELREETVSPRNKSRLARALIEGQIEISKYGQKIISKCLVCLACEANCPSGLKIAHIILNLRSCIVQRYGLDWKRKLLFREILSKDRLLPTAVTWARIIRSVISPIWDAKLGPLSLSAAPKFSKRSILKAFDELILSTGKKTRGRLIYFPGCLTNHIYTDIGNSIIRILTRIGFDIILPKGQMCCGIPMLMAGEKEIVLKNISRNLNIMNTINSQGEVLAIIVNCATCGAALKKGYMTLLKDLIDQGYSVQDLSLELQRAEVISAKTYDISEFLWRFTDINDILKDKKYPLDVTVTYQDPCHLIYSQGIKEQPREILKAIPGLRFKEMAYSGCCGSGGAFQLYFPELSSRIVRPKLDAIEASEANIVATGCPACMLQIGGHLKMRGNKKGIEVIHTVQLLETNRFSKTSRRNASA